MVTPLSAVQSEGSTASGEAVQGCVYTGSPTAMARPTLVIQEKARDQAARALGCLPKRDAGEVSISRPCLKGSPLHQMGGDHIDRQGQTPWRTATQGGHPHSHDLC